MYVLQDPQQVTCEYEEYEKFRVPILATICHRTEVTIDQHFIEKTRIIHFMEEKCYELHNANHTSHNEESGYTVYN